MSDDDVFKLNEEEKPFEPPPGAKPKVMRPRDAATLILVRGGREVMMGQRARGHVFMPDKWVFPGGKVDRGDARAKAATELTADTEALLRHGGTKRVPRAYALAAVRETREETGIVLGGREGPPLDKLMFVARAITPPYRPRRFDARFFMADAGAVLAHDEPESGEELLDVKWFSFDEAMALDLPSITRFMLKEALNRLQGREVAPPFLRWSRGKHTMERLTV